MLVHQLYSESPKIRAMQVKETAFPNINFEIPRRFCLVLAVKQAVQKNFHNPGRPRNKQTKILLPTNEMKTQQWVRRVSSIRLLAIIVCWQQ